MEPETTWNQETKSLKKVTVTDDMSVITLEQSLSALIHYVLTTGT